MSNLIGQQLAHHYQIQAMLGQGRIGTVYQAIDIDTHKPVAVKVISLQLAQQTDFRRRFLEEIQAIPRLEHPSIITIHEAGVDTERDILYMTMDYVTDRSLTAYLQQLQWRGELIDPVEAFQVIAQVAEGLHYAHQKGVFHRDIRPNIILFKLEEDSIVVGGVHRRAMIGDFGLVTLLEAEAEPFEGSLPYYSPEQCLRRQVDGRSDLYGLGVVLYQLVTNQLPFEINSLEDAVQQHVNQAPLPPRQIRPELPLAVEKIILRAMAKRPEERFQTGAEMAKALRETAAEMVVSPTTAAPVEISAIDTVYLSPENIAISTREWSSVEDRVSITQDVPRSLNRRIISIGRSESNDIALPSTSVTRRHAQLERTATGWQIRDLGSTNGTLLDGTALLPNIPTEWASHQTVGIGPYFLQLHPGQGFNAPARPFELFVVPSEVDILTGKQADIQVIISNQSETADNYNLAVERLPADWVSLSQSSLHLAPGQRAAVNLTIKPSLNGSTIPGKTQFLMAATSEARDHERVAITGTVNVLSADDEFEFSVFPAKVKGKGTCQLQIRNIGIKDSSYTILGSDPDNAVRFGEWRQPEQAAATPGKPGQPSAGGKTPIVPRSSFLRRLPIFRQMSYAPQRLMSRVVNVPRQAMNRILPGLGSLVSTGSISRQFGKSAGPKKGTPAAAQPRYQKPVGAREVIYPDDLRTQVKVAAGQLKTVAITVAPRKRALFSRHEQTHSFEFSVFTDTGKRQAQEGELTVKPRLQTRFSGTAIAAMVLIFALAASVIYATSINKPAAALLFGSQDLDQDGLANLSEIYAYRTDPNNPDTDRDGLTDGDEVELGLDPHKMDTDDDSLSDIMEQELNTNPLVYDTDGDSLSDGLEVRTLHTDPLIANSDPIIIRATATNTPPPDLSPQATPETAPEVEATSAPPPPSSQTILTSLAADDGTVILENGVGAAVISNEPFIQIGDSENSERQSKGFVSFDTSSLRSDAAIQTIQLRLKRQGISGSAYALGQIHVDIAGRDGFSSNAALEAVDFAARAGTVNAATLSKANEDDSWAEGYLNLQLTDASDFGSRTQLRLYFTLPNNGDGVEDGIAFYSGNHPNESYRPQLVITYQTP